MASKETQAAQQRSRAVAIDEITVQLRELTALRLRRVMSDEEFVLERQRLEQERKTLEKSLSAAASQDQLELLREVISFSKCALEWFACADDTAKRLIMKTVGSNFLMADKILSIQAMKPFRATPLLGTIRRLCTDVEEVRTLPGPLKLLGERFLKDIKDVLDDQETATILSNIKVLREQFAPEEHHHSADAA